MALDLNPLNWNWQQAQAAGKHVASYAAGAVTVAAAWGLVSSAQSQDLTVNLQLIFTGAENLAKGIAGLAAVLVPIYTAFKSAHNASPAQQVEHVVAQLAAPQASQTANAIADPTSRAKIIEAVAEMPEVKKVVPVDPALANAIPSMKVVTS